MKNYLTTSTRTFVQNSSLPRTKRPIHGRAYRRPVGLVTVTSFTRASHRCFCAARSRSGRDETGRDARGNILIILYGTRPRPGTPRPLVAVRCLRARPVKLNENISWPSN